MAMHEKIKIAFISSFVPRRCGIATFTSDLVNSIQLSGNSRFEPAIIAMVSDVKVQYGKRVKFRIRRDVRYDYIAAADYINYSDIDAVSVQHEFGLFGGEAGEYLGILLGRLKKPVITTLHTVLDKPTNRQYSSMMDVCRASEKLIVMNRLGIQMLEGIYGVPPEKVELIPHGVPDLPFSSSSDYKRLLGITDRKVILTFGLLNKNKGIEIMLRALPEIVKKDPSVLYIILGGTHPEVLKREGQSYKQQIEKMAAGLGIENHVYLHNHYVSDEELYRFLSAADIYVTPYLFKQQLTSGTLAFAVGSGKAVVSTPYWAAQELLDQGRGILVPFGDHRKMAKSVIDILEDEDLFNSLRENAYQYGRSMTWPRIGQVYWNMFRARCMERDLTYNSEKYSGTYLSG